MRNRLISLALAGALSLALVSGAPASQGSGCMPTTGTVSGLSFSQLINQALAALISGNSGASAPATDCSGSPQKGQIWLDTSVTPNIERRYDGNSWIAVGAIDSTNHLWSPPVGGGTASITAANTTDICAAPSAVQTITGTTSITGFGTACVVGARKTLIFNSATPLTYNATSFILPGQRDYTTNVGDAAEAIYLGAGNWRVLNIAKIDGSSVTNPAIPLGTIMYGTYGTPPAKTLYAAKQAVLRASYPDYLNAVTRVQSATLTAGNNTLTSVVNTDGLGAGMPIEGTGIPTGTTIASVTSSTIVMSSAATANGSQPVRAFITGYGNGGDSTTVGLPDCRARTLAGRDNVVYPGGSGRISATYFGGNPNAINVGAGYQSSALSAAENGPHVHTGVTGGMTGANPHTHKVAAPASLTQVAAYQAGAASTQIWQGTVNGGIDSLSADINHGHSFTTDSSGTGAPFSNIPPTLIAECVVVVLP